MVVDLEEEEEDKVQEDDDAKNNNNNGDNDNDNIFYFGFDLWSKVEDISWLCQINNNNKSDSGVQTLS